MSGKIKLIYVLAALVVLLQAVDGVTTYLVLSGDPERRDANPVAATIFETVGLTSGLPAIKIVSAVCAVWVLARMKRGERGSENKALVCLSVCVLLMLYVATNNIVETYYHLSAYA